MKASDIFAGALNPLFTGHDSFVKIGSTHVLPCYFFQVLVNVAPPKPTRLLTESERKALLNHDASPETPESPISQKHLIIESESQPPTEGPPFIQYSLLNQNDSLNISNLGWDALTEELLLSLDRQNLFPSLGDPPHLDMDIGTDWIHAPLASPEILSAASSMSAISRGSSAAREQKSDSNQISGRLETIQQSPDVKIKSETPVLGSVEDICDTGEVNENRLNGNTDIHRTASSDSAKDFLLKPLPYNILNGSSQDIPNGSMNNLLKSSESQNSQYAFNQDKEIACDSVSRTFGSFKESKGKPKPHSLEFISNVSGDNHDTSRKERLDIKSTIEVYDHHSPEENNQFGYGNPNEVYSAACIGYHPQTFAGYHPPSKSANEKCTTNFGSSKPNKKLHYSQSESHIEVLSDKYKMKRSTEQGDIAHMGDTTTVFVPDLDKKRTLHQNDSSPQFDLAVLPRLIGGISRLDSVEEHVQSVEKLSEKVPDSSINSDNSRNHGTDEGIPLNENGGSDDQCICRGSSDKERKSSNIKGLVLNDCLELNRSNRGSLTDSVISPTRFEKLEDCESPLFNSNSYHSTSVSSFSGESDKHLSSVSGQSDISDLPIVETDV